MSKVAIVSDSNSGITQLQAEELGITILPMPFFVGDKTLYEDIDLSQKEFYQMLSGECQYFHIDAACRECDRYMGCIAEGV